MLSNILSFDYSENIFDRINDKTYPNNRIPIQEFPQLISRQDYQYVSINNRSHFNFILL